MGQISIPMLNKVGYSMYWSSMWDNKINYSRAFRDDIYLEKFINLLIGDSISINLLKLNNKNIKNFDFTKYNIRYRVGKSKNSSFLKYLKNNNKVLFYPSKAWILKYQKWVIIYFFVYMPYFNKLNVQPLKNKVNDIFNYRKNLFNLYSNFLKLNEKIKLSNNYFKKNYNPDYF